MPELDFALLSDYVRTEGEGGVAHVIAAGMNTITAQQVPTGQNVGLLVRLSFTRNECDRPHRVEVIFQDVDGERLVNVGGVVTPRWSDDLPVAWRAGILWGLNIPLPLPRYGVYALELLVNDNSFATLDLRVVPPPEAAE